MGTSRMSMYQLLGSLCHNRGWNYAVFWKLKNQNSRFLTWSVAHCDFPKSPDLVKNVAGSFSFNNTVGADCFGDGINGFYGSDVGHPLELAVANMSHIVYSMGEGLIGQMANGRKHHWVFAGKDFNGGEISTLVSEFPDEWKAQFAAGIKTIALVPVLPYGLVQLGSLETMREDAKLVEYIRSLFGSFHIPFETGFPFSSIGCVSELLPPLGSLMAQISAPSAVSCNLSEQTSHVTLVEKEPGLALLDADNAEKKLLNIQFHSPVLTIEDNLQVPQNGVYNFGPARCHPGRMAEAVSNNSLRTKVGSSSMQNWLMENCLEQNIVNNVNFDSHSDSERCLGTIDDDTFKFPASSELHKALGEPLYTGGNNCFGKSTVASDDGGFSSASPVVDQFNLEGRIETLLGEFEDWFMSGNSSEHLLDAVVADACFPPERKSLPSQPVFVDPSDISYIDFDTYCEMQDSIIDPAVDNICQDAGAENMSFRLTDVKPSRCELKEFSTCVKVQSNDTQGSLPPLELDRWSCLHNGFVSWSEQSAMTSPTGSSITLSTLIDDVKRNSASALSKNEIKLPKINKKRAKPGESCRPRPRDRQQIQDRIKELRELVPNGAKCSIDALFERTIKHVLFLRGVTNHVDKLKNCARQKVVKDEASDSGASWAVDLGSQPGSCPLIVENLNQPGHMLVEMLCEEHEVFLEIAQVIRSLGLTILKGEMETRADKIWAHFVIEVTRGFQRMDILWPLMQLLQPRSNVTLSKF